MLFVTVIISSQRREADKQREQSGDMITEQWEEGGRERKSADRVGEESSSVHGRREEEQGRGGYINQLCN